jgi:hypothetical protein
MEVFQLRVDPGRRHCGVGVRRTVAQHVESRVLRLLGMKTTTPVPTAHLPHLAIGYGRRVPGAPRDVDLSSISKQRGLRSLASTVEDLALISFAREIPTKAGIQARTRLDSGVRRNDDSC